MGLDRLEKVHEMLQNAVIIILGSHFFWWRNKKMRTRRLDFRRNANCFLSFSLFEIRVEEEVGRTLVQQQKEISRVIWISKISF